MRTIYDDLNEGASSERPEIKRRWNKVLKEKFGMDLCDVDKNMAAGMANVLKRGKIRNDDEFVRVTEWVDHLIQDYPTSDNLDSEVSKEIEAYNKLIADYEAKAAAKLERQRRNAEKLNKG